MIIDFTQEINNNISVYSEDERPNIEVIAEITNNLYEARKINIFTHTGTHIDSPRHVLKRGKYINEYPLDKFIGKAIILDLEKSRDGYITKSMIEPFSDKLNKVRFILLNTEWSKYWCTEKYNNNYPILTKEAAEYLASFKIDAVGVDCISIGKHTNEIEMHKIFLEKDILIIENLNLSNSIEGIFDLIIAPLKIKNSDGAPVRVIGVV